MITEEEAKKKWCPMVRCSNRGDGADNRAVDNGKVYGTDIPWDNCVASGCMMWREDLTREEAQNGYPAKSGHCGLARRAS